MADHYRLLLSLSQNLSKSNVQDLVFLCFADDVLSASVAERITSGRDLFLELQRKACITPNNYDFLRERLALIGRNDLAAMLPEELEIILGKARSESSYFGGIPTPVDQDSPKHPAMVQKKRNCFIDTGIAHRKLLLQISEKLTSNDTKKLAYLAQLSSSSKEDVSAVELFQQLEEHKLISPENHDFLISCLKDIGRIDLAGFLDLALRPQALLRCLDVSHQHLAMKLNVLQSKNSTYATQVRTLKILMNDSNYKAMFKTWNTALLSQFGSCSYRAILPHSKCLQTKLQSSSNATNVAKMIDYTLVSTFQFLESYIAGLKVVQSNNSIDCEKLAPFNKRCNICFSEFEKIVSELQWNSEICQSVCKEVEARRTPIGAPAHVACTIIHDIAKELYGGELIEQESTALDKELITLEMGHYTYCYLILMLQWLATLICLATSDVSNDFKPVIDLASNQNTLLKIVSEHQGSIIAVWPAISQNIGLNLSQKICSHFKSAGIHLTPYAELQGHVKPFDPLSLNFCQRSSVPSYTFLAQLLAIAFVGPDCFRLEEVSSRLMQQHLGWMSSQACANIITTITTKTAVAFHERVEALKKRSIEIDQLCAPLIKQLTISD